MTARKMAAANTRTVPLRGREKKPRRAHLHILRVAAGMDMLQFAVLDDDSAIEIGRQEDCELYLQHDSISRRHARVERRDGRLEIIDLGSTNGTTVRGETIDRAELQKGDRFLVGSVSVRYDILTDEELEHLSLIVDRIQASGHDSLTGLLTRRDLEERIEELLESSRDSGQPASCLFLDVDRFKEINDHHGHLVGDEVLSSVAKLIHIAVRRSDSCIRYGGDEVLILVADSDERRVALIAERILRSLKGHDWGATLPGLRVTASCGVAEWNGEESAREWLDRADQALLAAKKNGRDRVLKASDEHRRVSD